MYITLNNRKGDSVMRKFLSALASNGAALALTACSTVQTQEMPSGVFNAEDEQELRTAATAYVTDERARIRKLRTLHPEFCSGIQKDNDFRQV